MKYLQINNTEGLIKLKEFIDSLTNEKKTFRYFESRPLSVILNHFYTCLYINELGEAVTYGHIDYDNGIYWIGIVTKKKHQSRGYGKQMMNYLIKCAKNRNISRLTLSCDISNSSALNLYKSIGFKQNYIKDKLIFMEKNL